MFDILSAIVFSQILGPSLCFDYPNFAKLTVLEIFHEDSEWYDSGPVDEEFIKIAGLTPADIKPQYIPARTIISVHSKHGRGEITIDEETGNLMTFGVRYPRGLGGSGSADIGVMFFGLPGIIMASPMIAAHHFLWKGLETVVGMERHAWSVWLRIKNQLDPETYFLTEKAFQKYKGSDHV